MQSQRMAADPPARLTPLQRVVKDLTVVVVVNPMEAVGITANRSPIKVQQLCG
jgi:hypothetical protein